MIALARIFRCRRYVGFRMRAVRLPTGTLTIAACLVLSYYLWPYFVDSASKSLRILKNLSVHELLNFPPLVQFEETEKRISAQRQRHRKLSVEHFCQKHKENVILDITTIPQRNLANLLFNDKYSAIYCFVPKVVSTNWKRIFLLLQGMPLKSVLAMDRENVHMSSIPTLGDYHDNKTAMIHRLRSYTKFLFVRDPWERLLSAYRDKFANDSYASPQSKRWLSYVLISRKYSRPAYSQTFESFIKFLVGEPDAVSRLSPLFPENEHWALYNDLCHPCAVHYDVIGKYETLEEDIGLVFRTINITHLGFKFPKRTTREQLSRSTSSIMKAQYSTISESLIQRVKKLYSQDFELFSYSSRNPANRGKERK